MEGVLCLVECLSESLSRESCPVTLVSPKPAREPASSTLAQKGVIRPMSSVCSPESRDGNSTGREKDVIDLSTPTAVEVAEDKSRTRCQGVKLRDLRLGERLGARRDGGDGFQVKHTIGESWCCDDYGETVLKGPRFV